jgi:hypothetical protein
MANPTTSAILKKTGDSKLLQKLAQGLSPSELNSLLLEVFREKAEAISPADLLKHYQQNRFVQPSTLDAVTFLKAELVLLEIWKQAGFMPLELSPLAPLGNCSALALVDQNKVISALRGTEVVADATNLLALEAVQQRKASGFGLDNVNYCVIHRHVRAQALPPVKGFTAHFKIFCAVTAGKDKGNLEFEKESLLLHLQLYAHYLVVEMKMNPVKIILKVLQEQDSAVFGSRIFDFLQPKLNGVELSWVEVPREEHHYYQRVRFSINVIHKGNEMNLGDGGFVDWSQKLSSNNKERMLTSGLGLELLLKMKLGLI